MTKGIRVDVYYTDDGPEFVLHLNDQQSVLNLDEVDVLSDLLRLKIEETIRHYQELLNKTR